MLEMQEKIKTLEAKANPMKGIGGGLQGNETEPKQPKKRKDKALSQDIEFIKGDAAS
jgi:hypothetical protein